MSVILLSRIIQFFAIPADKRRDRYQMMGAPRRHLGKIVSNRSKASVHRSVTLRCSALKRRASKDDGKKAELLRFIAERLRSMQPRRLEKLHAVGRVHPHVESDAFAIKCERHLDAGLAE